MMMMTTIIVMMMMPTILVMMMMIIDTMVKDGPHKMGNFSRGPPAPLELALLHIANNWHRITPSIKYYNATFNCKQSIISLIFKRGISNSALKGRGSRTSISAF